MGAPLGPKYLPYTYMDPLGKYTPQKRLQPEGSLICVSDFDFGQLRSTLRKRLCRGDKGQAWKAGAYCLENGFMLFGGLGGLGGLCWNDLHLGICSCGALRQLRLRCFRVMTASSPGIRRTSH